MNYIVKAKPLKRPRDYMNHEVMYKECWFICPHCLRTYKANISTTITYSTEIDRSQEGVVTTQKYFCSICGDYAFEVDQAIADPVLKLLTIGIQTYSSCSGHVEKFGKTSFSYEQGALGINKDYITYGPCISMLPAKDKISNQAFKNVFKKLKETHKEMILLDPEEEISPLYFFIAPVLDAKEYRKCGDSRRQIMLEEAQCRMSTFVTIFVSKYFIEKRKIEKMIKEAKDNE